MTIEIHQVTLCLSYAFFSCFFAECGICTVVMLGNQQLGANYDINHQQLLLAAAAQGGKQTLPNDNHQYTILL